MSFELNIPLYGGKIVIIQDPLEFVEMTDEEDDLSDHRGIVHFGVDENSYSVVYYVGVFDNELSTLVHELSHTCLMIVARSQFSAHDGNGEPFSYLLDYLFSQTKNLLTINQNLDMINS
jgi:hypothetical protein